MANAFFNVPVAKNEPVRTYAPGTSEHINLINKYKEMYNQAPIDVPMYINGEQVRTTDKKPMTPPHDHQKILGHFNYGTASHVEDAINAARKLVDNGSLQEVKQIPFSEIFLPTPYFSLVQFGKWDEVLTESQPSNDFPYTMAMNFFLKLKSTNK